MVNSLHNNSVISELQDIIKNKIVCTYIPLENEINIIINKATNVWGTYSYKQDFDVVRVKVPLKEAEEYLEAFSMTFDRDESGMILHMGWGNYRASLSFMK